MIIIGSKLKAADNAGGILFKCINIGGGFKRRYARLGEVVSTISSSRKVYRHESNKQKLAKLARRVKKKRKIKNKKKKQPNLRPYLSLIVTLRHSTKRRDGSYIKSNLNRAFTFTEPTRFGPAGKTENIPNFMGTKCFSPACLELVKTPKIRTKFKSVILKSGGIA